MLENEFEEQLALQLHVLAQGGVEDPVGRPPILRSQHALGIDGDPFHIAGLQPLSHKVLHEAAGAGIVQHPLDLALQIGPQFLFEGQTEEFIENEDAPALFALRHRFTDQANFDAAPPRLQRDLPSQGDRFTSFLPDNPLGHLPAFDPEFHAIFATRGTGSPGVVA